MNTEHMLGQFACLHLTGINDVSAFINRIKNNNNKNWPQFKKIAN